MSINGLGFFFNDLLWMGRCDILFSPVENGGQFIPLSIGVQPCQIGGAFDFAGPPDEKCQPWINKPRLQLFNWEGTIKKYQTMTIGVSP